MMSFKIELANKIRKNGKYPVILRIIKDRQVRRIPLKISAKLGDFENEKFNKRYPNYRKRNIRLGAIKLKAEQLLDEFLELDAYFSVDDFVKKFTGEGEVKNDVWNFFSEKVTHLNKLGKTGTAKAFEETSLSLKKFHPNPLNFLKINVKFLEDYEVFLKERGNQDGGIAFKMRHLRALINEAIQKDVMNIKDYPFKKYKISKLKSKNTKKALSVEELKAFEEVNLSEHPHLFDTHNFFMFSFYTRGMNMADMTFLKWTDIRDEKIYYSRRKTGRKFVIGILPPVKKILSYYKNLRFHSTYIFPILLKDGMTPKQVSERRHKVLSRYNSRLKEIGILAGISKPLSSYVARHSYATIMKYKGVSVEVISESLGHSNLGITMNYLKEFDNDIIDREHKKLLDL